MPPRMVPGAVGHNEPRGPRGPLRGSHKGRPHIVRSGIRNPDDNAAHLRWLAASLPTQWLAAGSVPAEYTASLWNQSPRAELSRCDSPAWDILPTTTIPRS